MVRCKGCGKEIIFITTENGEKMPCDAEPVMYWQKEGARGKIVTPNGEVRSCIFEGDTENATGIGYIPHWVTCEKSNNFRKKKGE